MTHTPAPTGAAAALAQLHHLYRNLIEGGVRDTAQAKRIAGGLLAPAIAVLERVALASAAQPASAPAAVAEPVAWLHDDPQRYDVIHAEVKDLLVKYRDAAGHLHRPLDKSAHYTIPLYTAPTPAAQEPAAVVVPCRTPSGKRVALYSAKQDLPIGTQLYTAPQPSPTTKPAPNPAPAR